MLSATLILTPTPTLTITLTLTIILTLTLTRRAVGPARAALLLGRRAHYLAAC